MKHTLFTLAAVGAISALPAHAVLINLGPGSFTPAATVITFSEVSLGSVNPSYSLAAGSLGTVGVDFGGGFVGGATPSGPLALNPAAPATFTIMDGSNPSSPVLSGTPTFAGPVSILFSTPVAAVGLDGGYFDAIGGTTIEAFDATGASLGTITNSALGIEFFGLADSGGANVIKGISFYISGSEPAGYAIDNVTFGAADVVVGLPDGGSTALMLLASLGGLVGVMKKVRRHA